MEVRNRIQIVLAMIAGQDANLEVEMKTNHIHVEKIPHRLARPFENRSKNDDFIMRFLDFRYNFLLYLNTILPIKYTN